MNNLSNLILNTQQKIAFICSPRLGDTLISFVVLNNLHRNGYAVDIYGDFAYALKDWFPWAKISPNINLDADKQLQQYEIIFHMYESELSKKIQTWHKNSYVLDSSPLYRAKMSMVDIQVAICEQIFKLKNLTRENGVQPLPGLTNRKHQKRIIVHPTSSHILKSWPAQKFVALAKSLTDSGWQPQFILSPQERLEWQNIVDSKIYLPQFDSFNDTAKFIYESAWFIGNDSGIGHLASNLSIPTLSIMLRPSVARQWRPSWSYGQVILPPAWLITRPLKEKFWKYTISVDKVLKEFDSLIKNYSLRKINEI